MVHLTRSTCLFKENDSAKITVVEKAPSSKQKKKKKTKKKQKVQAGNATDDADDTSTAVGSPCIVIMRACYSINVYIVDLFSYAIRTCMYFGPLDINAHLVTYSEE